jgi:hypothetical protein
MASFTAKESHLLALVDAEGEGSVIFRNAGSYWPSIWRNVKEDFSLQQQNARSQFLYLKILEPKILIK